MNCHNCKAVDSFQPWEGTMKLRGVEILARGERCRNCDEILFDGSEVKRQERTIATGLVQRGLKEPRDFQFVRRVASLKGAELADLIGVRPETVSRWERGEVEIPRYAVFMLGELFAHPRVVREKLEQLAR